MPKQVAVELNPFTLDIPRDDLMRFVRSRIASSTTFAASLTGKAKHEAQAEIERLRDFLDHLLLGEGEDDVVCLVVPEDVAQDLAEEQFGDEIPTAFKGPSVC